MNGIVSPSNVHYLVFQQSRDEEKETREGEGEDVQSKGHMENNNISAVDSNEISCEVIQSESMAKGNYNHIDTIDNQVEELDELW